MGILCEQGKLSIYDKMLRDEIQIEAEKQYAVREALEAQAESNLKAVEAARQQGIEQNCLETARKMKADNMPIEIICKYTQLTPEQIEAL